jgi:hypothetical protein
MMLGYYGTTIGLTILLFLLMGVFIYSVRIGLNKKDSTEIDPLPPELRDKDDLDDNLHQDD